MKVTVEGFVQGIEKAEGNKPTKVYLLQTGSGKPYVAEITFWPASEGKPGSTQKVPEIGKPARLQAVARGDKFGLKVVAD